MSFNNILSFGTLNPDFIYFIDELPTLGGDIRSNKYLIRAGGTATNCAENIANWGLNVGVAGNSIGSDELGKYMIKHFENSNINYYPPNKLRISLSRLISMRKYVISSFYLL